MVILALPNIVKDAVTDTTIGKWTMIYDEGFEVITNTHNFFAFSKYKIRTDKTPKNDDDE